MKVFILKKEKAHAKLENNMFDLEMIVLTSLL